MANLGSVVILKVKNLATSFEVSLTNPTQHSFQQQLHSALEGSDRIIAYWGDACSATFYSHGHIDAFIKDMYQNETALLFQSVSVMKNPDNSLTLLVPHKENCHMFSLLEQDTYVNLDDYLSSLPIKFKLESPENNNLPAK